MSTLMPGMMPWPLSTSTNWVPSAARWKRVSSKRMDPEMYWPSPGAEYSSSRHARRLSSVFSTPTVARRLPVVALDSSEARLFFFFFFLVCVWVGCVGGKG